MTMMACGHAANAVNGNGDPSCVICVGIDPGAEVVAEGPDLTNRIARCSYYGKPAGGRLREGPCNGAWTNRNNPCMCERPSSEYNRLAFFGYKPDKDFDEYYCGCWGWD